MYTYSSESQCKWKEREVRSYNCICERNCTKGCILHAQIGRGINRRPRTEQIYVYDAANYRESTQPKQNLATLDWSIATDP